MNIKTLTIIPDSRIESRIFFIRGKKVMLDRNLAELYGVETKTLNRAAKRNRLRFPPDFMFQLTKAEADAFSRYQFGTLKKNSNLKYQIGTSSYGGRRKLPYAFTEQGVAMLSSVLNSKRAIQVNIQIIRTFTKLRELIATNKELREKIEKLESKYNQQFRVVFEAIKQLLAPPEKPARKIGFNLPH
ncbi:MAG: ORF6N domain-containing protein [bacterium]|nr:ORF6N domain-containing protein [bacterium]